MVAKQACLSLTLIAALTASRICAAQTVDAPGSASDENRRAAHDAYEQGKAAFEAQDYLRAGQLFLDAYAKAPHYDPLWNAARAYDLGGETARAANLYTQYLEQAPPEARDRDRATAARRVLSEKLGRIDLQERGVTDVAIDGSPARGNTIFVDPGTHLVTAHAGAQSVRIVQSVAAGAAISVVVQPAPPPPPPSPISHAEPSRGTRVLPPIIVIGGAVLTLAAAGITTWSAFDTVSTKHAYENAPSTTLYEDGQSKESRTNALFWTSAGLGVVTGAIAIFFTNWHSRREEVRAAIGPGSLRVEGTF